MKIKLSLVAAFCCVSFFVEAQKDLFQNQLNIFRTALQYNDYSAAANALYQAIELKPKRTDLKDTLCLLYFTSQNYVQSFLLSNEILKSGTENLPMLEVAANSKKSLGFYKEALIDFDRLNTQKPQLQYQYQIATLQYQLKRVGECLVSLDKILTNPAAETQMVTISAGNTQQSVPFKAAALNIKGIVATELGKTDEAQLFFKEAIRIAPDFALAKNNLQSIAK